MVNTVNAPSLVGMVDPVEGASYELPEQIIPVEVVLIKVCTYVQDISGIVKLMLNAGILL